MTGEVTAEEAGKFYKCDVVTISDFLKSATADMESLKKSLTQNLVIKSDSKGKKIADKLFDELPQTMKQDLKSILTRMKHDYDRSGKIEPKEISTFLMATKNKPALEKAVYSVLGLKPNEKSYAVEWGCIVVIVVILFVLGMLIFIYWVAKQFWSKSTIFLSDVMHGPNDPNGPIGPSNPPA